MKKEAQWAIAAKVYRYNNGLMEDTKVLQEDALGYLETEHMVLLPGSTECVSVYHSTVNEHVYAVLFALPDVAYLIHLHGVQQVSVILQRYTVLVSILPKLLKEKDFVPERW